MHESYLLLWFIVWCLTGLCLYMLTLHASTNVPLSSARPLTSYPHPLKKIKKICRAMQLPKPSSHWVTVRLKLNLKGVPSTVPTPRRSTLNQRPKNVYGSFYLRLGALCNYLLFKFLTNWPFLSSML